LSASSPRKAAFDSESVLALPAFQAPAVAGRRVLILRGDGGRDLLGDTLRARGAEVEYLTCYHRNGPTRRSRLRCWIAPGPGSLTP
jgi:uroporphyrinogen-III synthase